MQSLPKLAESIKFHSRKQLNRVRVLDKYKIRYELYPFQQHLNYALKTSPDCKVLYTGQITALFERVRPGQK